MREPCPGCGEKHRQRGIRTTARSMTVPEEWAVTCPRCFEPVTRVELHRPRRYYRIREWLLGHRLRFGLWLVRPCGHSLEPGKFSTFEELLHAKARELRKEQSA